MASILGEMLMAKRPLAVITNNALIIDSLNHIDAKYNVR